MNFIFYSLKFETIREKLSLPRLLQKFNRLVRVLFHYWKILCEIQKVKKHADSSLMRPDVPIAGTQTPLTGTQERGKSKNRINFSSFRNQLFTFKNFHREMLERFYLELFSFLLFIEGARSAPSMIFVGTQIVWKIV